MDANVRQLIHRGRAAFERNDYEAALADFQEVLEHSPHFADIRHLVGLCYSLTGRPEQALEEFDRAIALNAHYIEAHLNRAITLNELGRFEEAGEAFDYAGRLEIGGRSRFPAAVSARLANAHMEVGDLYLAAASPAEAAEQYRIALALRPRFHDIRNKLAHALIQLGDLAAAEDELRTALMGNPRFTVARINLGLVYYRRGALDEATAEWREVAKSKPEDPQVRAFLSMIEQQAVMQGTSGEASKRDAAGGETDEEFTSEEDAGT